MLALSNLQMQLLTPSTECLGPLMALLSNALLAGEHVDRSNCDLPTNIAAALS